MILDCHFGISDSWLIPDLYSCVGTFNFTGDPIFVTEVSQRHVPGLTNNDVKRIFMNNQVMTFIPRNISNFFPNIESIEVFNVGLTELTREALNGFPKLRQMNLNPNNIQIVSNDVFEGNPVLEKLALSGNPIRSVAHNVFDHLTKLDLVHMFVPCIGFFGDTRVAVENFIFQVSVRCPPTQNLTKERILNGLEFQRRVDEKIAAITNPMTMEAFQMGRKLDEHEERIRRLEN